ncbi:MAG: hypothetical protein IJ681_08210 [Bacteroidales bacterium]|nr:hypothetical protein [Bacteroidales bacterium]
MEVGLEAYRNQFAVEQIMPTHRQENGAESSYSQQTEQTQQTQTNPAFETGQTYSIGEITGLKSRR